jgi:hypothetical protein
MSPTESTQQRLTSPVSTRSEALRFRLPGTAANVRFRQSGSDRRLSLQGRLRPPTSNELSGKLIPALSSIPPFQSREFGFWTPVLDLGKSWIAQKAVWMYSIRHTLSSP